MRKPDGLGPMKQCCTCKEVKTRASFFHQNNLWDKLTADCKDCRSKRQRELRHIRIRTPSGKQNEREKCRRESLGHKFRMTVAEYEQLHDAIGGLCEICGNPETTRGNGGTTKCLAVDHCHVGGHIRGLLCGKCNKGIGMFKDDPKLMEKAAAYVRRTAQQTSLAESLP